MEPSLVDMTAMKYCVICRSLLTAVMRQNNTDPRQDTCGMASITGSLTKMEVETLLVPSFTVYRKLQKDLSNLSRKNIQLN